MRAKPITVALCAVVALACAHSATACDKLTPADAAVLSKQQLSRRYCGAQMGAQNARKLIAGMNERGITQDNPVRLAVVRMLLECTASTGNIEELYREKYRSPPPKPDLTKDCPG